MPSVYSSWLENGLERCVPGVNEGILPMALQHCGKAMGLATEPSKVFIPTGLSGSQGDRRGDELGENLGLSASP